MNILFTCGGRRVELLNAFRRAMCAMGLDGRLIVTDATHASAAYQKADVGIVVPPVTDGGYIPALLEIVEQQQVGLMVPLTDLDLVTMARHRDCFAERGCTVMIGSESAVARCTDNSRISEILTDAGLPALRTCTIEEFRREPFYPCFVKPVASTIPTDERPCHDEEEFSFRVGKLQGEIIVQECVIGREYTIDVYRSRDGKVRSVVPRQRLEVRSGEVHKGITVRDNVLIDAAVKLASAIGDLWGVYCCQCRCQDDQTPRFFEINPRFGGGSPLSVAAGANLPLYLLQEVTGRAITAEVGGFIDRLLMLRYDESVFVQAADPTGLPGYEKPRFR